MAKKYNADDYDLVQNRIQKFYREIKEGRILTDLVAEASTPTLAVFRASVYDGDTLKATGWASEKADLELKKTAYGKQYESVNFSSHLENAETSAIGRALANFGRHGNKRASREEMEAVKRESERFEKGCQYIDERMRRCETEAECLDAVERMSSTGWWDEKYEQHAQGHFDRIQAKINGDR